MKKLQSFILSSTNKPVQTSTCVMVSPLEQHTFCYAFLFLYCSLFFKENSENTKAAPKVMPYINFTGTLNRASFQYFLMKPLPLAGRT